MYRSLATASSRTLRLHVSHVRPFSLSASRSANENTKTDKYPDDKHAMNKVKEGNTHNIQESNMKGGMDANKEGSGGHATEGRDSADGAGKAKKDFPESPDPGMGMQDERGGRGG